MVGLLQLKLPTSTPAGFLINGLIMNLLQYIFPQAENLVFQFPKSRGRIFLCVSPTFASPIEKPATSALRRICREIIENTEGNAKTVDSLRRCKWTNSTSKSAPKTKKPTRGPVGEEFSKWSGRRGSNPRLSAPKADALATALRPVCELLKITHPRPIFKPVDDYSPVSGLIFRTYSSFSRSIAIFTPGSGPKRIPFALSSYSAPSSTVPVL